MEGHGVDVREARGFWPPLDGLLEERHRLVVAPLPDSQETERMQGFGTVGGNLECPRQGLLAVGLAPLGSEEIRQIDQGRHEVRIEAQRSPERSLCVRGAAETGIEIGQVQVRPAWDGKRINVAARATGRTAG